LPRNIFFYFSPKSPPNSPNPELATFTEELKGVYINRLGGSENNSNPNNQTVTASELIWDWTSRPNVPPKYDMRYPGSGLIYLLSKEICLH
jgi:BCL2/adenovirus E1B protein-interacting protein 3